MYRFCRHDNSEKRNEQERILSVSSTSTHSCQSLGCTEPSTPCAYSSCDYVDQMKQASTVLEETVQGAAKVLSEAAETTKSATDAAKQVRHRHPPLLTRCRS